MRIRKAIVPLAGLGTRLYPVSAAIPKGLFPFVLPNGRLKTGIELILEMLVASGIEQVCLVVSPDSLESYQNYFSGCPVRYAPVWERKPRLRSIRDELVVLSERITYFLEEEPYGLAHAIWCARDFAEGEPVLVALGDHLFLSENASPCAQQVLEAASALNATVIGVHQIHKGVIDRYGVLKGVPTQEAGVYQIADLVEKPTLQEAERRLRMRELPEGHYLAHFGLFAFTPALWSVMETMNTEYDPSQGEWQLTDTEQRLLWIENCYALEVAGLSLDYGVPEGYRLTFAKIAGLDA